MSPRQVFLVWLLAMLTSVEVSAYTEKEVLEFYKKMVKGQDDASEGGFCSTKSVNQFDAAEWVDVILEKSNNDGILTQKEARADYDRLYLVGIQLCDMTKNLICAVDKSDRSPSPSPRMKCHTCTPDGFPEGKEKRYCEIVAKVVGLEGDPKIKVEAPTEEEAKKETEEKKKEEEEVKALEEQLKGGDTDNGTTAKSKSSSSSGESSLGKGPGQGRKLVIAATVASVVVGVGFAFLLNLPQD